MLIGLAVSRRATTHLRPGFLIALEPFDCRTPRLRAILLAVHLESAFLTGRHRPVKRSDARTLFGAGIVSVRHNGVGMASSRVDGVIAQVGNPGSDIA